jgi:flagellar M-ring protein FliF
VFLKLEPGTELGASTIRAIVSLVANAVDGLESEHVSVADDRGNLLAAGDGGVSNDALGEMKSLVEYRSSLEARYERAVSQVLLPVLGYGGGFSVTATVELDPVSKETTTRQLDADKQAVVSQVDEEQTESRSRAGGVPGVDANLPELAEAASGGPDDASSRTSSTTNFAYPSVDEISRRPAGGVQRVSVAVQVDAARVAALVEGSNGTLDADTLQKQIDAAVSAAIGYDSRRNDQVTVSYLPFALPVWTEGTTDPAAPATELVNRGLPYLFAVVVLALLLAIVVRPVVAAAIRPIAPEAVAPQIAEQNRIQPTEDPDTLALRLKALVDGYQPVDHADLNRLVDQEPEMAADVLRNWARAR